MTNVLTLVLSWAAWSRFASQSHLTPNVPAQPLGNVASVPTPALFDRIQFKVLKTWVGPVPQLTIGYDGTIEVAGVKPLKAKLKFDELRHVLALTQAIDWTTVNKEYRGRVTDNDDYQISILYGQETLSTSVYAPGMANEPQQVNALINYLSKILSDVVPAEYLSRRH